MLPTTLKNTIKRTFAWVMPSKCLSCAINLRADYPVCDNCYPDLPFQESACRRCGQSFAAKLDYCGRCIVSPSIYDSCFCAFKYKHPINHQIKSFKYSQRPEFAMQLARLLHREIENHQLELPDLLIPVPIHISKLRERGFNQSLELCKCLSKLFGIPYANNLIIKHCATHPQAEQTLKHRHKNIKNSFSCIKQITPKHVAIIDDVVTTGATVAEMTKILKRNGVDYVQVWGIAHTI